jgi:hypothetical protein
MLKGSNLMLPALCRPAKSLKYYWFCGFAVPFQAHTFNLQPRVFLVVTGNSLVVFLPGRT